MNKFLRKTRTFLSITASQSSNQSICKYSSLISNLKCQPTPLAGRITIHTTSANKTFWERTKKGHYGDQPLSKTRKELLLDGLSMLRKEIGLWTEEMKEKLTCDPIMAFRPGEVDVVFDFTESDAIDKWVATSDSDHNEGYSRCSLTKSPAGFGLFSGTVDSRVPMDGKIKRAGYCNMKSIRPVKSFQRNVYYDWNQYNMLVIRLRGDGRSYLINLATELYFDILWNDVYHYVLYTRGGPHWQTARIPFSKFFLSSKGRVQDKQGSVILHKITNVGFSVSTKGSTEGDFNLEIDYIGLEYDPNHTEEFAYEMYKLPSKYMAAT